jgi:transglutaminase/protease-like cytokinesis protein 3
MMKRFFSPIVLFFLFCLTGTIQVAAQEVSPEIRQQMKAVVADVTKDCHSDYDKAKNINLWISKEIQYDHEFVLGVVLDNIIELFGKDLSVEEKSSLSEIIKKIINEDLSEDEADALFDDLDEEIFVKMFEALLDDDINWEQQLTKITEKMQKVNQEQLSSGLKVFEERKGICSSISNLYQQMCAEAGIKCQVILGVGKIDLSETFLGIDCLCMGHAWTVVEIGGRRILVDPTWSIEDEHYFDVSPELMAYTHLPIKEKDQCLDNPISIKQFLHLPYITSEEWNSRNLKNDLKASQNKSGEFDDILEQIVTMIFQMNSQLY